MLGGAGSPSIVIFLNPKQTRAVLRGWNVL